MIPKRYLTLLLVCLTFSVLLACEPLAPEQTTSYVIVTGETPDAIIQPTPTAPLVQTAPAGGSATEMAVGNTQGDRLAGETTGASAGGIVNTPVPTNTPIPAPTAIPSPTPFVCSQAAGQVYSLSFFSEIIGEDVAYRIYLPPCFYETLQRYPYVILLHGTSYDDAMWIDLDVAGAMDRGVTKGSLPPMALVMPDGGWLSERNDQPEGASYEDVILDELIPTVERDFCLWGGAEGRAIGGVSRGGFWAFSIALRHPDLFSAVGGHSPHFEPNNARAAINPLDLARSVSLDKTPLRIYMDHATDDYVGTFAEMMAGILRDRGIQHDYVINPTGNHDTAYWSSHVPDYLVFYGAEWPYDISELPSCLEPVP